MRNQTKLNDQQKQMIHKHGSNDKTDHVFETVEGSLEEAKRLISWLEYVSEDEFTKTEREKLINVSRRFANIAQPIASKYID